MRKSLLIVNRQQFGYHSDTYYYCKYLPQTYQITYVCWDYGRPRLSLPDVEIVYVPRAGAKLVRFLRFLRVAISHARRGYDICFLIHFPGCSAVKISHPNGKHVVDIRTAEVTDQPVRRILYDGILKIEARLFANITVISPTLACSLNLDLSQVHILPLGSDVISRTEKTFETLRLIYVGTLHNRRIADTIIGFHKFIRDLRQPVSCCYRIIGSGYANEVKNLKRLVQKLELQQYVHILGPIPHDQLSPFFDDSNVGISYIPKIKVYDVQPPTKTFEYLLSGMAVVATSTRENMRVIDRNNGVLIEDNAESFCEGLEQINERKHLYDSECIRQLGSPYLWSAIVENNLLPYLENL